MHRLEATLLQETEVHEHFALVDAAGAGRTVARALPAILGELGCEHLRHCLAGPDILFRTDEATGAELETRLTRIVSPRYRSGFLAVVRSAVELRALSEANPFAAAGEHPQRLRVLFLQAGSREPDVAALLRRLGARAEIAHGSRGVVHVRLPARGGLLVSREQLLAAGVVLRRWPSVLRMCGLGERTARLRKPVFRLQPAA